MAEHAVAIAGAGPTGLMLAGELARAGIEVAIFERRAGGLHARTIEVLDQRGIADRFLAQGQVAQVAHFHMIALDISDFPTRHRHGLALWHNRIERILADRVGELGVPIHRAHDVIGFTQDDTRVDVQMSDGSCVRADRLEEPRTGMSHGTAKRHLRHRGAQHAGGNRVALGMVAVEKRRRRRPLDRLGQLPSRFTASCTPMLRPCPPTGGWM